MRPHGRAQINARAPRATAICDRCGFFYNHDQLSWQWDWQQGPRLFNLRILVCSSCLDIPQESGRTIVLPPDPVPIANPRPENYVNADNPASYLGYNVANNFFPQPPQSLGGNIGTMVLNAGVDAAFNSATNKRAEWCAALSVSNVGYGNWVGKNWAANPAASPMSIPLTPAAGWFVSAAAASMVTPQIHLLSTFTLTAPNDRPFLNSPSPATGYHIDGSADSFTWTTLASGTTAGTIGETITGSSTSTTYYQYHRVAFNGDGFSSIAIAQAVFNIADAAPNDI